MRWVGALTFPIECGHAHLFRDRCDGLHRASSGGRAVERDDAIIHALVREESRDRLRADDRIRPVIGDLSKERLGVEGFDERIDHFFHLAAVYDLAADEDAMTRANVEGTRNVVEFANSIDVGRFHHTSSIAVAGRYSGTFTEDMFDEGQELPHAYHRTKYESEQVVRSELRAPH